MNALDVVKDSERCRGCVGNCIECEYDKALDQIENAIETLCELIGKETPKMPIDISSEHIPKHGKCPNCGNFVVQTCSHDRCSMCGQILKWEEKEQVISKEEMCRKAIDDNVCNRCCESCIWSEDRD